MERHELALTTDRTGSNGSNLRTPSENGVDLPVRVRGSERGFDREGSSDEVVAKDWSGGYLGTRNNGIQR